MIRALAMIGTVNGQAIALAQLVRGWRRSHMAGQDLFRFVLVSSS
jgi:hypothetical protein